MINNDIKVIIPCECHTEELRFEELNMGDDRATLSIWVCSFYACQEGTLWRRLKFAWWALTKGYYRHNEMALTTDNLKALRDGINEVLNKNEPS